MNAVFIATSLDGYIADEQGGVGWLDSIEYPKADDMGYGAFMSRIDALVMGRKSFETVCGFDVDWPYDKPLFVLSNTLKEVSEEYRDKAFPIAGELQHVLRDLYRKGYRNFNSVLNKKWRLSFSRIPSRLKSNQSLQCQITHYFLRFLG